MFKIKDYSGAFILQYQIAEESVTLEDQLIRDMKREYLEYGLSMNLEGSIYHPGLLTFNIDFKVLSFNSKELLFTESSTNNDLNNTYNIVLSFLNKRKLNFRVFATKDYNSSDRRFMDRFFTRSESYGVSVSNVSKLFPFRLKIYRLSRLSESLSYAERDEDIKNLEFDSTLIKKDRSRSNFRISWKDYYESVFSNKYRTFDMVTDYYLFYGNNSENVLSSVISYRKMDSVFKIETFQLTANIKHYLLKDLSASSNYSFRRNSFTNSNNTSNILWLSLQHKLFDSLNSFADGGFNLNRSENQDYDRFFLGTGFNYKKKIPKGFLNIHFSGRFTDSRYISNSVIAENSRVESFSLSDTIILSIFGVKIDGIRITDKNLSTLYVEGIDYEVETDGISIIITRIPGGDIPEKGSVNIVYEYLSYPDYRSDLSYTNLGFSLNLFKYFRIFYGNEVNGQKISSEFLIRPFEEYSREKFGMNFNSRNFSISYFSEEYLSAISGYNTENFSFTARAKIFRILNLNASYYSNYVDYLNGDLFGKFKALLGEISASPSANTKARILYRKFNYETYNSERFRESIILRLNWKVRKIIVDLYYEYILNSFGLSSNTHNYFSLMVRRVF